MERFDVFEVPLHDLSEDELRARLLRLRGLVVTPNPEILLAAREHSHYRTLLQSASLSLPDGIATEFAVAALHHHLQLRRHPGVDAIPMICAVASELHEALLIIGGFEEDHQRIQEQLRRIHPTLTVRCFDPGLIQDSTSELNQSLIDQIRSCGPSIALVALGQGKGRAQGKQERIAQFILNACTNVRCAIGVGGSIGVLSGRVTRGPAILRRLGFEWLWRLFRDPWRLPRIFRAVVIFPLLVTWDTLQRKHFWRSCVSVLRDLIVHFTRRSV